MSATKARACLEGRPAVTVDDALEMAPYVLTHRLICEEDMTPEEALRVAMETPLI
jgi:MoxR-like ATPase